MGKISSVSEIRKQFPALEQQVNGKRLVYLDNGATAHKPQVVIDLINQMNSRTNGNIHRAVHELSAQTTALYESARVDIQKYLNAAYPQEIIFTSGTTASINLVAYSFSSRFLNKGDAILISEAEHHSNIVPWQMACEMRGAELRVIPIDENGNWIMDSLDKLLDHSVKLVAVSQLSNVLGIINPIEDIISKAHSLRVPVLIDGAQGVVHTKVDLQKLDCDFYAFSGHKLYGPTGIGVLYGKKELLDSMPPWMGGGDMVDSVTFKKTTYAPLPLKFEAGTPNFIGAAALGETIRFMNQIDLDAVSIYEKQIVAFLKEELAKIEGVKVYGISDKKTPLFSISVEGAFPSDIAMIMDKLGIALRSGLMCAEPLMKRFGTESMLRASFGMYNTLEEAQIFIDGLKRALKMLR